MEQLKVAILGGAGFVGSRLGDRLFDKDIFLKNMISKLKMI
jgi:nucleoside-diphosphate-sugar epimerase